MSTLIKGGTVVTEEQAYRADIAIADGRIVQLGDDLAARPGVTVIDATEKLVLPGLIDTHVHFQLPFCGMVSKDDFIRGSQAAACGGVTTFIDFATQERGESLVSAVERRKAQAVGATCVDFALHATITDWSERTAAEVESVVRAGIPSFKMYMIYRDEGWMASDSDLYFALRETAKHNALVEVHAENVDIIDALVEQALADGTWESQGAYAHYLTRPAFTEAEAVQRAVMLARETGGTLVVVHTSSSLGLDEIARGKSQGVRVLAETCPQYLLLDASTYQDRERGHLFATCPPVRQEQDREALWKAAATGGIDFIGTDTCTFDRAQKDTWDGVFSKIPFGLPGVETLLPLVFTRGYLEGRFSLERLVALTSTNAARTFGLYPRKGTICCGSDADLVVVDPKKEAAVDWRELRTNSDWSPYQGMNLRGWPEFTMCRGRVVARWREPLGEAGWGRFIPGYLAKNPDVPGHAISATVSEGGASQRGKG